MGRYILLFSWLTPLSFLPVDNLPHKKIQIRKQLTSKLVAQFPWEKSASSGWPSASVVSLHTAGCPAYGSVSFIADDVLLCKDSYIKKKSFKAKGTVICCYDACNTLQNIAETPVSKLNQWEKIEEIAGLDSIQLWKG